MMDAKEYMKDHIDLNYGERYEFRIDQRGYTHKLSSCEIKAKK